MPRRCQPNNPPVIRMKSSSYVVLAAAAFLAAAPVLSAAAPVLAATYPDAPDVPPRLDLQGAIGYALEHNFSILQARERIKEQEGLTVQITAAVLPNVSLVSNYSQHDQELNDTGAAPPSKVPNYQSWGIALDVRQSLYAGGGIKASLDAQRLSRQAALLDLRAIINTALLAVRTRFYDVLLAREQIAVQEQNVRLLREQLQTVKNRFDAGTVSNFEVLRAEVELANAQPDLIRARNRQRTSIDALRQAVGYSNVTRENLRKIPEFLGTLDFTPVSYDLQKALDDARSNRPELLRLEKLARAGESNVRIQKAGYLPSLDLVGSYGVNKFSQSNRLHDSLDGWTVGLQSNWAIFDGRATAGKVAQARSQLNQARLTFNEQVLSVEVEVRSALSSLQEATELAEAAQKVVTQAEESLRLANARYNAGTATQLDVLQAQVALTQSRTNQLEANYSYNVAVANVRKAIGLADTYSETVGK